MSKPVHALDPLTVNRYPGKRVEVLESEGREAVYVGEPFRPVCAGGVNGFKGSRIKVLGEPVYPFVPYLYIRRGKA